MIKVLWSAFANADRDLTTYTKGNKALQPARTYTHHSSIVNDVQYHPLHSSLIGTVSDDITLQILDTRVAETSRAAASAEGQHRDAINAVAFNPAAETVLATGSADKTIGLWDLRNLKTKLHTLENHADSVTSISWHPFEEAVLASASYDRKIMFWDLSRAGEEQTPEDAQDGPPELCVFSSCVYAYANSGHLDCSCTAVTPIAFRTLAGTLTTLGCSAPQRRTISCRCGRLLMQLLARIWKTCRPRSWSHDSPLLSNFIIPSGEIYFHRTHNLLSPFSVFETATLPCISWIKSRYLSVALILAFNIAQCNFTRHVYSNKFNLCRSPFAHVISCSVRPAWTHGAGEKAWAVSPAIIPAVNPDSERNRSPAVIAPFFPLGRGKSNGPILI